MKALVGTLNQEKALVGALSVIVKTGCGSNGSFYGTTSERVHLVVGHEEVDLVHPGLRGHDTAVYVLY